MMQSVTSISERSIRATQIQRLASGLIQPRQFIGAQCPARIVKVRENNDVSSDTESLFWCKNQNLIASLDLCRSFHVFKQTKELFSPFWADGYN